jgi:hypothetical protein
MSILIGARWIGANRDRADGRAANECAGATRRPLFYTRRL